MGIPNSGDYETFLKEFSYELEDINGVSFFIYGSKLREDFVPGVSDLDGFLVLDDNFVTNKDTIKDLSRGLEASLRHSNQLIKAKFNVLDKGIAKDGRFLIYPKSFVDVFKKSAVKIYGRYDINDMASFDYKNSDLTSEAITELNSISHNLNRVRKSFLYKYANAYSEKKDFYASDADSPLKRLTQLPGQLIYLSIGVLITKKDEASQEFFEKFSNYSDSFVINHANQIMQNPVKYNSFLESEECFAFSLNCLTEMERMIQAYVEKFPNVRKN